MSSGEINNTRDSGNTSTRHSLDSSFRLELVSLPVQWCQSPAEARAENSGSSAADEEGIHPQKLPWVAAIFEELRRTDNILVTEIGERGLLGYLQGGLMASSTNSSSWSDEHNNGGNDHRLHSCCHWEFQEDTSFRYLMEILQANMIYFLKKRYFDLERCRETSRYSDCSHQGKPNNSSSFGILEDFQTIFDKASSTRYLAHREKIAYCCFQKPYQQKGNAILSPKTIQRALVRLHRRAGIYLPDEGRYHPAPIDHNRYQDGIDAYWIDLWWVCSSLLLWILEPCLEIAISLEIDPIELHRNKKRKVVLPDASKMSDAAGFAKQSQKVAKIPLLLIQAQAQRLGLFYDKVLLHDGPWDENLPDEDYFNYIDFDRDGDEDEEYCSDEADDKDSTSESGFSSKILGEANGAKGNETIRNTAVEKEQHHWEGKANGFKGNVTIQYPITDEQGEGKGTSGERKNHRRASTTVGSNQKRFIDGEQEGIDDLKVKALYDSFWASENETLVL